MTAAPVNDALMGLDTCRVWDTAAAFAHLAAQGEALTKRTAERRILERLRLPPPVAADDLVDEHGRRAIRLLLDRTLEGARRKRRLVLFARLHRLPSGGDCLLANDARKGRYWIPLDGGAARSVADRASVRRALAALRVHLGKAFVLLPCGELVGLVREGDAVPGLDVTLAPYLPPRPAQALAPLAGVDADPYLRQLEAESIYLIREAAATAKNPALLHALGKDSAVLLHLARKAFHPGRPPLALLHVATGRESGEALAFRDLLAQESGMPLTVCAGPESTGSARLARAIERHGYDLALSGMRGDEGNADEAHQAFPLARWTELDVWRYIGQERIPVLSLHFARERPVVIRDGAMIPVDDDAFRLLPGEEIIDRRIRFRSLGGYPLAGAVESAAGSVDEIVAELLHGTPRRGRPEKTKR